MRGLITNDWDRDNLNFLLNATPEVLQEWDAQVDEDDKKYAQELLDAYAEELRLQAKDLEIEAKISLMMEFNTANSILKKFAL